MRYDGILRTWNDARGFGFIAPTRGGAEVFVHRSAFARDGTRPVEGERLSFELAPGRDGKPQAVHVVRAVVGTPALARPVRGAATASRAASSGGLDVVKWLLRAGAACVLLLAAHWGYGHFQAAAHRFDLEHQPPESAPAPAGAAAGPWRCDGRTQCSQMTSCAEATWFINHCPGTKMDGNHDGVPCEQQLCRAPGGR